MPHHQSELLAAALKNAGVRVTFYTVKGAGHGGFTDPKVPELTRDFLALGPRSLREAAAGLFSIGVGLHDRIASRTNDHSLLFAQFNVVTPENCMKPAAIQAAEGRWDFAQPDAFVNFTTENHLKIVGHCLVWAKDDRTPEWFFRDGGQPARRELVLQRKNHFILVYRALRWNNSRDRPVG